MSILRAQKSTRSPPPPALQYGWKKAIDPRTRPNLNRTITAPTLEITANSASNRHIFDVNSRRTELQMVVVSSSSSTLSTVQHSHVPMKKEKNGTHEKKGRCITLRANAKKPPNNPRPQGPKILKSPHRKNPSKDTKNTPPY